MAWGFFVGVVSGSFFRLPTRRCFDGLDGRIQFFIIVRFRRRERIFATFSDCPTYFLAHDRAILEQGNAVDSLRHGYSPTHQQLTR
jgi:hypothetical protein